MHGIHGIKIISFHNLYFTALLRLSALWIRHQGMYCFFSNTLRLNASLWRHLMVIALTFLLPPKRVGVWWSENCNRTTGSWSVSVLEQTRDAVRILLCQQVLCIYIYIYINHICNVMRCCRYFVFDDVIIIRMPSLLPMTALDCKPISNIQAWCAANCVKLNVSKIRVFTLSRKKNDPYYFYKQEFIF
jgi:hypothetical protein